MLKPSAEFFANGKLLLTAEYFVLHGARALALPVKYGQSMVVCPPVASFKEHSSVFFWQSFFQDQLWFSAGFDSSRFNIKQASDPKIAETLARLLKTIGEMNPQFHIGAGTGIKTVLDFNPQWGLGSSSTLVANMAAWAGVDPYLLNEKVFGGSGFDIACANADGPVFYCRGQKAEPVTLDYPFADRLFLVYSGKKKSTQEAIVAKIKAPSATKKKTISALTEQFANCKKLEDFQELIRRHEQEVAALIGEKPVQQLLFADFDGAIKSLGAWGGDFLLAATSLDFRQVKEYFERKGRTDVFKWENVKYSKL